MITSHFLLSQFETFREGCQHCSGWHMLWCFIFLQSIWPSIPLMAVDLPYSSWRKTPNSRLWTSSEHIWWDIRYSCIVENDVQWWYALHAACLWCLLMNLHVACLWSQLLSLKAHCRHFSVPYDVVFYHYLINYVNGYRLVTLLLTENLWSQLFSFEKCCQSWK